MFPTKFAFNSVFQQRFDVVVFGAGFIGFSLSRLLAEQGKTVLLVESSGDLLWEATRALENSTSFVDSHQAEWTNWLESLEQSGLWLDVAHLEVKSAHLLKECDNLRTLLYASPVSVTKKDEQISGVTVATKSGFYQLQANHWIDATETGYLTCLCHPELNPRTPKVNHRSLVLQSLSPDKLDAIVPLLRERHRDIEWFQSSRESERRLRWQSDGISWHRKTLQLMGDIRQLLANKGQADCLLSHCAMRDFPVYETASNQPEFLGGIANLSIGSPVFRSEALSSLSERFAIAVNLARTLPQTQNELFSLPSQNPIAVNWLAENEVLVVGTGTAGAVAAIASARNGTQTVAIDATTYPGGVGTGAGINSYFHGVAGGLQDEIDKRTQQISELLNGNPSGLNRWHHEAKKFAILQMFEEAGVTFIGDAMMCDVEVDAANYVRQVTVVIDGKLVRLSSKTFIDSSGDGDLCALAGASFVTGREGDGRTLSYSQSVFSLGLSEKRLQLRSCNFDAGWVDPTNPEDLSQARLSGIAQHIANDWKAIGCPIAVAPLLGLRQSRQICTDVQVNFTDMIAHTQFADAIGQTKTVADTHSVDFEFESDELAFYYWTCRAFREPIGCELPYRMLLPRGLNNVWIACRAAGIAIDATYGLRMQRDLQRMGEAAGIAASMASKSDGNSRKIDLVQLQYKLGIKQNREVTTKIKSIDELIAKLDKGIPDIHLWHLYQFHPESRATIAERLNSSNPRVSFYAASILAMWGEACAESRLIQAIKERESGPSHEEFPVQGAFGQCIALPFWLQSVVLLRRIGSNNSLAALCGIAAQSGLPFNVLTILARTLESLASRLGATPELLKITDLLLNRPLDNALLPPSHSLWATLHGQPQKRLGNSRDADTNQDHSWQLHLVIARLRHEQGLELQPEAMTYLNDSRAYVRHSFEALKPQFDVASCVTEEIE